MLNALPAALDNVLRDALSVDLLLPIAFSEQMPAMAFNRELLQAAVSLESQAAHSAEDHRTTGSDLARLEAKVDLVVTLLARLVAQAQPVPTAIPCRIGTNAILWPAQPGTLQTGSETFVGLYISPHIPLPVWLSAEIRQCRLMDGTEWIEAALRGDTLISDDLQRWVFHCHRRQIAAAKPRG